MMLVIVGISMEAHLRSVVGMGSSSQLVAGL
jgi:hypothetical protein